MSYSNIKYFETLNAMLKEEIYVEHESLLQGIVPDVLKVSKVAQHSHRKIKQNKTKMKVK